jgi:hypothetical protein
MGRYIVAIFVVMVVGFLYGCCDPNKPKAYMRTFPNQPEIILKGFDDDCDGDLDYWQHYKHGVPFGRPIRIK